MAETTWKIAGTGASETISGGNSTDWTSPSNITADDDTLAHYDIGTGDNAQSAYLKGTNFGFTASDIPSGSTIDGIEFRYDREEGSNTDNISTNRLRPIKGGTIGSTDVSGMDTSEWDNASEVITEGSSSDLWGETWTQSDILSSDFGIALAADCDGTTPDAYVDYFEVRIHYTEGAGGAVGTVFNTPIIGDRL